MLRAAATFRQRRQELQEEQMARLAEALALPQMVLPAIFAVDLGLAEVDTLAAALATAWPPSRPAPAAAVGVGRGVEAGAHVRTSW